MNELVKYEESFWAKIKRKFLSIFKSKNKKNTVQKISEQKEIRPVNKEVKQQSLTQKLKDELLVTKDKVELADKINDNFDIVMTFPEERIKQVSQLFEDASEIRLAKIADLKRKIQMLENGRPSIIGLPFLT